MSTPKRYAIRYGDNSDYPNPPFVVGTVFRTGYDAGHALEKFYDSNWEEFTALAIAHVPEEYRQQPHRWIWETLNHY